MLKRNFLTGRGVCRINKEAEIADSFLIGKRVNKIGALFQKNGCFRCLIAFLCSLALLSTAGCTTPTRISSDQVKEFRNQIQQEHPNIREMTLEFSPLTFRMNYRLEIPINEQEKKEIFEKSRQLLMSETFYEEVILSEKVDRYFSSGHPHFTVMFNVEEPASMSRFELHADNSQEADPIYKEWYYAEEEESPGEPFVEETQQPPVSKQP
ncbi:hypothetical protein QWJ34_17270 [Saccharibacillus sp. CPCC 101409]|uniref:hypothetical protein n=1 Tax=Saccharibacillus sp. CPCC 101409 TaxID=3058041 RepID=UPI002670EFC1|nr:hypothetical protein [Saccharibacillus sp. CPCC 101409]MDO3411519.1 hypothetical protein [Saccharibacillus sp. CPCC 101409]